MQRQAQAQQFDLTKAGMADLAPQVAAQDAYQTAAYTQATDPNTGLGAYQPFLTKAGAAAENGLIIRITIFKYLRMFGIGKNYRKMKI